MSPRRYEQRLRTAGADQTRRRILDAMYEQLPRLASVEAVARQAGVARSTVYLVFGSRAGLFDALTQDVLDRGGFADLVRAVQDPDPLVHLRGGITASVRVYAGQRDALWALRSMEQALDGALQRAEQDRLGGMEHLAERLAAHGLLRVPVAAAVDVLWLLTSFDAFDLLYTGRRLSVDEVAARLLATAEHALL
ncbi:transcriptional regulator, TetR family [Frankia casuarinae]|jgi:AcrR family transcriptional regulator|uniref:Transcriptional regulator, TetR family n=1 Tax=Frankia casuarinae (strain DSM 45818 / CECT 9043 / HFP020203 / CcI3) TaxID=106370 RepID=Q2J8U7_FRACC|nr:MULTISPECIES: TetR/AcrR family transcriptional regulator [Frankia]ABD12295.1 transcriptional regulator, TetR family [Frankia casuarinae]ETA01119.1 transcriptional regulator, TetR family [Frankia sp. CcI6]EYT90045.1 transcriptional regulator, TetR family [Frankia casuarinae]KDA42169.1 transcriptional regulator, TetR family [Frankia sp. BMG5.23]OAA20737.1 transcriptional regulator, tetR family [Frankia casuarinae]